MGDKDKVEIEWLSDYSDCETCGPSYAEGARVHIGGELAFECIPVAHCYGGEHMEEHEVYTKIIENLGYIVHVKES